MNILLAHTVLIFSIITTPGEITANRGVFDDVLNLSRELELIDKRENWTYTDAPQESCFQDFLCTVRRRAEELAGAPYIKELELGSLPGPVQAAAAKDFYRQRLNYLRIRFTIDQLRSEAYREAITETKQIWDAYDNLVDAYKEYYYVTTRREYLRKYKEIVGNDVYYGRAL